MFTFEITLAEDAWKYILKLIMEHGDEIEDEHDLIANELLNVIVTFRILVIPNHQNVIHPLKSSDCMKNNF